MTALSYFFGVLIACLSYVFYQRYVNVYTSIVKKPDKRYDYIIVGAGTAGCVLAARLSEDPKTKVLLVEAGDQMGYFTKIPLTATAAQLGPNDWSVKTKPQRYSSFGMWEQISIIPRGKGLGGSGQINFLQHGFGLPEDFERWSDLGFKGWTRDALKPYFLKAFGTADSEFDSENCSLDASCFNYMAPMKLQLIDSQNALMKVFKEASSVTTGKNRDVIFRKPTATIKNAMRFSSLDAYLNPALERKNLHVLLRTKAVSIRFEDKIASSLFILQNHIRLDNIFVNKEIILSAGAIKTPQVLMMSGIGPRKDIQRIKLKLIAENEYVGKNLHDHMNIAIYVSIRESLSITLDKVFTLKTIWDYYWHDKGYLAYPPVAGIEYQNSSALILFSMGTTSERLLRDLSNYKPQVFRDTYPFYNQSNKEGFMFLATCVQPRSKGTVTLSYSSTSVPPVVDPNYLHDYWDIKCMIKAIRRAERLVASKPFQDIGARIVWPRPERCLSFWSYSRDDQFGVQKRRKTKRNPILKKQSPPDAYLECIIRELAVTGHHVSGTCAGGKVVDDELRVKSVSGVRIVDASVLPSPISLFPNSVLVAMAERAADLIMRRI